MKLKLTKGLLGIVFCTAVPTVVLSSPEAGTSNAALQPRTNINPGLLYWQAFGAMPKLEEVDRKKFDEFIDQITSWSRSSSLSWAVKLPADADSLVKRYGRSLRLLHQARLSTTPCDWGTDPADGPEMLVPDTRGLRELSKVSLLKAAVQLQAGSFDESVDTLLSCVTLARQFAKDGTLVSVMLQQAVEGQFVDLVGAELGRYPPSAMARLQQGLTRLPPHVPVLVGVASERNFQRWMLGQVDQEVERWPGDNGKAYSESRDIVIELFGGDSQYHKDAVIALNTASGGSVDGLRNLLYDLGSFYDEAKTLAVAGPDSVSQGAAALEHHVETSSNPIARMVIANFGRARIRELSNLSRWAMMEASVAEVSAGDASLLASSDPLSKEPFQVTTLEQGVVELRSRTNLGADMNPVLRVMMRPEPSR
jgi:hypothetical protein